MIINNILRSHNNQTKNTTYFIGIRQPGLPPPHFDSNLLPKLDRTQIAWWDECHIEQQGGKVGDRPYQYIFRRDEDGKLSETGTYNDTTLTKTSFKYPEQGRFSFGVAKVAKVNEEVPVGVRMEEINYTGKNIVTIEVFEKAIKEEISRVKGLTGGDSSIWVKNHRPAEEVWEEDAVTKLPGAGGKKGDTLVTAGIKTVKDIVGMSDEELKLKKVNCDGISLKKLTEWSKLIPHPGACPHVVQDYRLEPNPYLARYGIDNWRQQIESSLFMRKYMCITELVTKIYERSKLAFQGTTHQDDWFFYHDALSQMTAKSTVQWMKQKNYYKRWLIPQNGLNAGTRYENRPVGNRPEFMPLDNSLNADIQYSLSLHCALTAHLNDEDDRKFSMRTPLPL